VVIPNVQRFIGAGETEAEETELANIQAAVSAMMVDNELGELPVESFPANLPTNATNQMGDDPATTEVVEPGFPAPDAATKDGGLGAKGIDPDGKDYMALDQDGYILYQHDITGDGLTTSLVNYVALPTTAYWYWVDASGTVYQVLTEPAP